jgi:hypothetical protein
LALGLAAAFSFGAQAADHAANPARSLGNAKSTKARTLGTDSRPCGDTRCTGSGGASSSARMMRSRPSATSSATWYEKLRSTPRPSAADATAARRLLTTKRGANCTVRGIVEPAFSRVEPFGGKLHESMPKCVIATTWCSARSAGCTMRGCRAR